MAGLRNRRHRDILPGGAGPQPQPLPPIAFGRDAYSAVRHRGGHDDTITLLTDDKLSYAPDVVSDSSQIAFARAKPGSFEECCGYDMARVWLMDADGANPRPVGPWGIAPQVGPQWMPDGESVVYTGRYWNARDARMPRAWSSSTSVRDRNSIVQELPGLCVRPVHRRHPTGGPGRTRDRRSDAGVRQPMEVVAADAVEDLEQLQWSPDDGWFSASGGHKGRRRWGLRAWKLR